MVIFRTPDRETAVVFRAIATSCVSLTVLALPARAQCPDGTPPPCTRPSRPEAASPRVGVASLRVLTTTPVAGTTLKWQDLEKGVPLHVVVEHAVQRVPPGQAPVLVAFVNLTPDANGAVLRADFTTPLFMSPDSKKVAVIANFISGSANAFEPFVIQVDGSGSKRLAQLSVLNSDAELIVWANNSTVFVQGDLAVNNDSATFELDATTTDQTPTLAVGVATGGDMVNLFVVP